MKRVLILIANAALVVLCCFLASGIIADVSAALLAPDVASAGPSPAFSRTMVTPSEEPDSFGFTTQG